MKKTTAILLACILTAALLVLPSSAAQSGRIDPEAVEKYLPKIFKQYESEFVFPEEGIDNRESYAQNLGVFEEVYDHTDEAGETDWTIIHIVEDNAIGEDVYLFFVLGGREIYIPYFCHPFIIPYLLYDAKQDRFVSFYDDSATIFDDYDGLYEGWQTLDLSDISPDILKGDANGDRNVDITDATHIQRGVAGLVSRNNIAACSADADYDGKVTVLDATRIQRTLAKLCNIDGSPYTEA